MRGSCSYFLFHDICDRHAPGVRKLWRMLRDLHPTARTWEWCQQPASPMASPLGQRKAADASSAIVAPSTMGPLLGHTDETGLRSELSSAPATGEVAVEKRLLGLGLIAMPRPAVRGTGTTATAAGAGASGAPGGEGDQSGGFLSTRKAMPCACWSTCTIAEANAFVAVRPRVITSATDPWMGYLSAVYGAGQLTLPYTISSHSFFYHHDADWQAAHPGVEWPMAPCELRGGRKDAMNVVISTVRDPFHPERNLSSQHTATRAAGYSQCAADVCSRWERRGDQIGSRRGDGALGSDRRDGARVDETAADADGGAAAAVSVSSVWMFAGANKEMTRGVDLIAARDDGEKRASFVHPERVPLGMSVARRHGWLEVMRVAAPERYGEGKDGCTLHSHVSSHTLPRLTPRAVEACVANTCLAHSKITLLAPHVELVVPPGSLALPHAWRHCRTADGCWFFPAVGSGIWLHVGRTLHLVDKDDALGKGQAGSAGAPGGPSDLLGAYLRQFHLAEADEIANATQRALLPHLTWAPKPIGADATLLERVLAHVQRTAFPRLPTFNYDALLPPMAHALGYDTVQVTYPFPEIVVLHASCMSQGTLLRTCAPAGLLRSGLDMHPCKCNESLKSLNCVG